MGFLVHGLLLLGGVLLPQVAWLHLNYMCVYMYIHMCIHNCNKHKIMALNFLKIFMIIGPYLSFEIFIYVHNVCWSYRPPTVCLQLSSPPSSSFSSVFLDVHWAMGGDRGPVCGWASGHWLSTLAPAESAFTINKPLQTETSLSKVESSTHLSSLRFFFFLVLNLCTHYCA